MTHSNQARGERYRQHTLELLGRLGYGSARQVARGVWGELTSSTRKMASRLLRCQRRLKTDPLSSESSE